MKKLKCSKCKKELSDSEAYEYRGAFSCEEHFEEVIESRDIQRNQLIKAEDNKTKFMKGLDFSDSAIGKANQKIFKERLEIASKESSQMKAYERGE